MITQTRVAKLPQTTPAFLTAAGGQRESPPDVEPGSDADIDRSDEDETLDDGDLEQSDPGSEAAEPSPDGPLEIDDGEQQDDNIDDLGRRPDGSEQDQPGAA